jgi:hypothetical protein
MVLRSFAPVLVCLPSASCAIAAGGTLGVHYTTAHSFRLQLELPLEVALINRRTPADPGRPYMRAGIVPAVSYNTSDRELGVGVRTAFGPVFAAESMWFAPAFTAGMSTHDGTGAADFGLTMDLELVRSREAPCNDLRFTNLLAPQVSATRRVYDKDAPFSADGGDWDFGLAIGLRHTRVVTCGTSSVAPRVR